MAELLLSEVAQDAVAVSLARAVVTANRRARELGVDIGHSLISITQDGAADAVVWRINYGPKDYVGRRGGDVLIEVESAESQIRRVLRGQ